jgi:5'-deoxynucleotidase YfbR-like HD superfamily hydrolase
MARNDPNDSSWIATYTGGQFWPLEPREEDVKIVDIAHALSLVCRWSGHIKTHYSVAQHSVHVSENVPAEIRLDALLHDASEAYIADLARPIKHAPGLGEIYLQVEKGIQDTINQKYGICTSYPEIKKADNLLLMTEKRDLMNGDWKELCTEGMLEDLEENIVPWSVGMAEYYFLEKFKEYGGVQ